ncbi:hypothetical protein ACHAW5_000061 [Stephanodiscus triporus]|uniref:Galectin n=1 Tax=Stephanodiscus triporus TaxID=2934178 RepID=A0ABD3P9U3_9STRA
MVYPAFAATRATRSIDLVPHTAYQVDFAAVNCGRVVASSKRNIRFKFGYTNIDALSSGKRGNDCRGAEHEILVEWSLSSGKQAIVFDSEEVFFDVGSSTQTKIKHSWKDPLGHTLKIEIHAANVSTKSNPHSDWRQYDLFIDGVSFFRMPKIFEIGVGLKEAYRIALSPPPPQDDSRHSLRNEQPYPATNLPIEETKTPEPEPPAVADLLSFDDFDAQPVPAPHQRAPTQVCNDFAPPQAPIQVTNQYALPQAMIDSNNHYATPQAPVLFNNSAPAPIQQSYGPSFNSFSAPTNPFEISLANYGSPSASPGMAPTYQLSSTYNEQSYITPNPSASHQPQTNCVTPTSSCSALVPAEPTSTGVDVALKKLVNIDDLFAYHCNSAAPSTKGSTTTMQQANGHMSLGQLQGSKKPVMNTYNTASNFQQQHNAGYTAQQPHQPQFNEYAQQSYAQPGFGYK